ncbi:glycosaminoglycan xylosylkinase isoform X2 [Hydra vulgaris]|uniref:Glycosaminoglycan xylosylkinase isoform X2 n=1 Tax=Hydra vulgaris TaxID=6087 RepID=A0ABM4BCH6_HYDVU
MKLKDRVAIVLILGVLFLLFFYNSKLEKKQKNPVEIIDDVKDEIHKKELIYDALHKLNNPNEEKEYFNIHAWDVWHDMISVRALTIDSDVEIYKVLKAMSSAKITQATTGYKGTQLKAMFSLDGPQIQNVVFKPKRYSRNKIILGTPYEGYDRHNAEIAAFHLDRLLGFYRAPPVVGRYINLATEVLPVAAKKLATTFIKDKDENLCFYGKCLYCNQKEPACANNVTMEGALILWLPEKWPVLKLPHPWRRTYNKKKAKWETDSYYCESVIIKEPYAKGPRLLDLIDTSIFDFLIGNADRHHYEYIENENGSMVIHLDNAKSFGNPFVDEKSILSPLVQCCQLRSSTYNRLKIAASNENSLSVLLDKRLSIDPIYPILTSDHLLALDRRLLLVQDAVEKCFKEKKKENVIIEDHL